LWGEFSDGVAEAREVNDLMKTNQILVFCVFMLSCSATSVLAQDAILPQNDPRLNHDEQAQEAVRNTRMKQQEQGPNYRVEGEMQGGQRQATAGEPDGLTRQDTRLSDPSVNPGQATDMEVVQGTVKQANPKLIIVENQHGKSITLFMDATTVGDRDVRPGDLITGRITKQGLAIVIHKETTR